MPATCSPSKNDTEAGFALISALWLSLALGLVGSLSLALAWRAVVRAELLVSEVEERMTLEGATIRAVHELGQMPTRPVPFSVSYTINGREITVEARPTTAWPDLNHIDAVSLANFLEFLGASPSRAAVLADTIADWREPAGSSRLNAARLAGYEAAGLPPPANRPFENTDELALVAGLSAEEAECLAGHFTLLSANRFADPAIAAHPALRVQASAPAYRSHAIRWTFTAIERHAARAERSTILLTSAPESPVLVFEWVDVTYADSGRCFRN
ncbi:hypothetical protein GCM10007420_27180 [Glycocaulis albus]|uniref:T2SS protein K first SAM-like domain-containing protein n=1 Tax=Glycocaulis albus TaxID=1382801 RepID=A0ABQ1Y0L4_9PROT|nr:type II secretion system protein GspK [Glycocaulis albus]GGH08927.1 hypothetical protein GCM10007420_27180 [Glycocaulis albus]